MTELDALTTFFRERLLTLADLARERGVIFFPMAPDPSAESYFADREGKADHIHVIDAEDLKAELEKLWAHDAVPELAALAGPLAELAASLRKDEETSDEVSPFIYAMF